MHNSTKHARPVNPSVDFDKWEAARAVRDSGTLTGYEKAVLHALILRADREGVCWPSYGQIAIDTGFSERTVKRAVAGILERGGNNPLVVRVRDRSQNSNKYELSLVKSAKILEFDPEKRVEPLRAIGSTDVPNRPDR